MFLGQGMASDCLADFGTRWDQRRTKGGVATTLEIMFELLEMFLRQTEGEDFHNDFVDVVKCVNDAMRMHTAGNGTTILGVPFLRLLRFAI